MKSGETRERGRGGAGPGPAGVERELRRLVPAAVPPGLRPRVLGRDSAARKGALLTPWMRFAAVAGALIILGLLVLDPILARREEVRWAALLDGRVTAPPAAVTAVELAEAGLGTGIEAERWARLQDLAASRARRTAERETVEALEQRKGWWDYETAQDPE